jgi:DNA helicase HerA-like ATPase
VEAIGRITGRSVGELRFRVGPDEPVALGQILIAEHEGQSPFYLRVTDLEYGAEDGDAGWAERTAGALMDNDETVLYDREHRLYKAATASPLGYLQADGRFRKPKTLPSHFASVRRPVEGDFAFVRAKKNELELGFLRSGDEALDDRLGLDPRALAQHVGIFATTGMGKSNLLKVIAGSCLESGQVGLLVLDPHGEYADGGSGVHPDGTRHKGLLHHPRNDRLVVYTSRPILGFEGHVHTLAIAANEIEVADFRSVYNVSDPQQEALWAARNMWGATWLIEIAKHDPESLFKMFGDKFHRGTWNVLQRRCENILQQPSIHSDTTAQSTTGRILDALGAGNVVLVDTSGLDPQEELLVSATLARKLLRKHEKAYREPETFLALPPSCVILEEAQRVLNARAGDTNVFSKIAREGRKFKVGLGAVTQQPRLISDELLSQFNTLFILGLADPTDRERVKGGARQDLSQLVKEIQMLEPGEALVTTPGAPFALPLMAHLYETRIKEVTPAKSAATVAVDDGFY